MNADELPSEADWPAALPSFDSAPIRQRLRIGPYTLQVMVSSVQREVPLEHDTHLVHLAALYDGRPLTPCDLGIKSPEACANVWAYLTNRLTETVVQFYAPRPRESGEVNPRLGCWGPRPDLVLQGAPQDDCSIAVVVGLSTWVPGASPPADDQVFLEALRDALVEALSYWIVVAQRLHSPAGRRN